MDDLEKHLETHECHLKPKMHTWRSKWCAKKEMDGAWCVYCEKFAWQLPFGQCKGPNETMKTEKFTIDGHEDAKTDLNVTFTKGPDFDPKYESIWTDFTLAAAEKVFILWADKKDSVKSV